MKSTKLALLKHIEQLQTNGQYWFVRSKVIKNLNLTKTAFKMAAYRLQKLQKICSLGKGFYLIIPLEYKRPRSRIRVNLWQCSTNVVCLNY